MLGLGQMERARLDGERLDVADMGDPEPLAADGLDILRPRIDVGHVLARLHHVRSGISTDRAGANDRDLLLRHYVLSHIRVATQLAARSAAILIRRVWLRHSV